MLLSIETRAKLHRANEEMARECFRRPVTLDGLVPTADRNDFCHFTMTGGVKTDARDVGTFTFTLLTSVRLVLELLAIRQVEHIGKNWGT